MLQTKYLDSLLKTTYQDFIQRCYQKLENNKLVILASDYAKTIEQITFKKFNVDFYESANGLDDIPIAIFYFDIIKRNGKKKEVIVDAFVVDYFDPGATHLFEEHGKYIIRTDRTYNEVIVEPIKSSKDVVETSDLHSDDFKELIHILVFELGFFSILDDVVPDDWDAPDFIYELFKAKQTAELNQYILPFLPGVKKLTYKSESVFQAEFENGICVDMLKTSSFQKQINEKGVNQ